MVARPARAALLLLLAAGLPAGVFAQSLTLSATVDRTTVHDNESFNYTLRAQGAVRGEPDLSALDADFDVLNRSQSSRIDIVNGQASQLAEWVVQLMPRKAGKFTLPPAELAGLRSNAVQIEVLPALAGSNAQGDIFMEVDAAPSTVYVQSQLVYTLRIFRAVSTGRATLTSPEVSGGEAIVEPLGEDREYQTVRNGRNFIVRERSFAIFPQQSGLLTIEPVTFEAAVMAGRGFTSMQRVRSDAVEFRAEAPVAPPPAYPQAAWLPAHSLSLTETWSEDPARLTVGAPLTRTLTVKADGLLETQLPELAVSDAEGLKQYADQPELSREATPDGLHAQRIERFAVIGQTAGETTLPAVELPWWNVEARRWEVARVPPRTLLIAPSQEQTGAPPSSTSADADEAAVPSDVRAWQALSAGLLVAWLATLAAWLGGRRQARPAAPGPQQADPAPRRAASRRLLRRIREACRGNDAASARRLLLEWAAVRLGEQAPRTLSGLAARVPPAVGAELATLEASLYGPQPAVWHGEALGAALGEIDSVTRAPHHGSEEPLLPLYR